jgi:hypothetical protein
LDGIAELAEGAFHWETKSSLPRAGSTALRRLREQILAFQRTSDGARLHLVIGNRFTREEMRFVLRYFERGGVDTSAVKMFNGLVHFAAWIGETYYTLCLER